MVALYSCARHRGRAQAIIALAASAVGMAILPFEFPELRDAGDLLFNSFLLVAAFAIGILARSWAVSRERVLRSALERARIARELHDVIAHTITVIVMQAGGARLASASDPGIAVSTLAQIEELGRSSLAELRSLLPLLDDGDDEPAPASQPTLEDVEQLCERMRALGLAVALELDLDSGFRDVPLSLQLTGYRVVQEGLTNVIRHSGMVETAVRISRRRAPAVLTIDVRNRMSTSVPRLGRGLGGGRGLHGLEDRVRLAGGEFEAGVAGDGFLLHVELPIEREAS